jgi:hypothetical protein
MRISFDFDGTLENDFDGTLNLQKIKIQQLAKKYLKDGHTVFIITKRYGPEFSHLGLKNEHLKVLILAHILGIPLQNCIFTNREFKNNMIVNQKIDMHFENSEYEVDLIDKTCFKTGHKCLTLHIESSNWRDILDKNVWTKI